MIYLEDTKRGLLRDPQLAYGDPDNGNPDDGLKLET
jgi:hypothetical protein